MHSPNVGDPERTGRPSVGHPDDYRDRTRSAELQSRECRGRL